MLHCSPDATLLYWGDKSNYKSIFLDQVQSIRWGLEVDPATPPHLVPPSATAHRGVNGMIHEVLDGLLHPAAHAAHAAQSKQAAKTGVLYGTETLRRNCKHDDLALCFSLILPSRSELCALIFSLNLLFLWRLILLVVATRRIYLLRVYFSG